MLGDVGIKLACQANEEESFLDFIRTSEYQFGLEEADVFAMSMNQLNVYIDDLCYLWDK
jgi:hypothetical protein